MSSAKKWGESRREGIRRNRTFSTREESAAGTGRPTTRGRFSESWKRLSSRGGSTKRGPLNSQQPPHLKVSVGLAVPDGDVPVPRPMGTGDILMQGHVLLPPSHSPQPGAEYCWVRRGLKPFSSRP
ncbi:hypothetical protein DPEC_G00123780 [Dallia pectoralis]|uniref:Uncharacterized protein n=1 Tax=Dallia pectoralis TaxID=75939 RepID=A0ACC2GRC7_DALPE|nr:hypothetical protein DPEC_G00123780 [Dallia pectoralis]